jgi:hypothetical protein
MFYHRYLSGPRLPPRTETVTEVIMPEYAKEAITLRRQRVAAKAHTAKAADSQSSADARNGESRSPKKSPRNRHSRPSKSSRIVLAPLPITHGFGDAEQRAERCRQVLQQRDRNTRGVLEGLSRNRADNLVEEGQSEVFEHSMSSKKPTAGSKTYLPALAIQPQHRPFSTSCNGILLGIKDNKAFLFSTSVRKYSILASNVRQRRRPPDEAFASKPKLGIWDISRMSDNARIKGMPSTSPDPSRTDLSNIGGFTESWKGEEWRGEEWSDAWGSKRQSCYYPRCSQLHTILSVC